MQDQVYLYDECRKINSPENKKHIMSLLATFPNWKAKVHSSLRFYAAMQIVKPIMKDMYTDILEQK